MGSRLRPVLICQVIPVWTAYRHAVQLHLRVLSPLDVGLGEALAQIEMPAEPSHARPIPSIIVF